MKRICVFCGSSTGANPIYAEGARDLGRALAGAQIALVYGGGGVGLMQVVADTVMELGGEVIGVIPEALMKREVGHTRISDLRVVSSMHERKALMAELSDAFIALPGGIGTFEELFEVWTWAQLGIHRKPCGLLDVGGYYAPLIEFLDHAVEERFLRPEHRRMLLLATTPDEMLRKLADYSPPLVPKWIDEG